MGVYRSYQSPRSYLSDDYMRPVIEAAEREAAEKRALENAAFDTWKQNAADAYRIEDVKTAYDINAK